MEKSYFEIKISFIHILIFLVSVIIIGIFLFYLGYRAGKASTAGPDLRARLMEKPGSQEKVQFLREKPETSTDPKEKKSQSISGEMALHQQSKKEKAITVRRKPDSGKRQDTYSIQVGAFANFSNAKTYSEKFRKLGYQTEIIKDENFYKVRVGSFKTISEAKEVKEILEKREKAKFQIKKSR
jgi:cell division septation protein DedD